MTPHQDTAPPIALDELGRSYGRGRHRVDALRDLSLRVETGQLVALMGATGSGKTTALHCAAGLDRPTRGHVRLAGLDVTSMREGARTRWRRQHVGVVFQNYNLLPSLTVTQNVLLPHRLGARTDGRRRAVELLDAVGLSGLGHRRVGQLSGGQQQRAAVARALLTEPKIVFADEPTGALDPTTGSSVLELLRAAADRAGVAVLMVTHDPRAAAWCDRVVVLSDGRTADDFTPGGSDQIASRLAAVATGRAAAAVA